MKPPPFEYFAPSTLEEALSLLAEHGDDAKVLAGGQSLVPLMSMRLAHPAVLVDLNAVAELTSITAENGYVSTGAMVRERTAERSGVITDQVPLLAAALPLVGHPAIRNRGTVGGSVAHADPAAELPCVAVALDAEIVARSRDRGERTIPAPELFSGYFTTVLAPDEILTRIRWPVAAAGTGVGVEEACRRHGDFAMVGAAASVCISDGVMADARVALLSVADTPVRARAAEAVLACCEPGDGIFRAAGEAAVGDLSPPSDLHASAAYRRRVGSVLVRRALEAAVRRAGAGDTGG